MAESLAACEALLAAGCRQIFFKYCSTFVSTTEGIIGPVADTLVRRLGATFALAYPAFPTRGGHGSPGPIVRRRRAAELERD